MHVRNVTLRFYRSFRGVLTYLSNAQQPNVSQNLAEFNKMHLHALLGTRAQIDIKKQIIKRFKKNVSWVYFTCASIIPPPTIFDDDGLATGVAGCSIPLPRSNLPLREHALQFTTKRPDA